MDIFFGNQVELPILCIKGKAAQIGLFGERRGAGKTAVTQDDGEGLGIYLLIGADRQFRFAKAIAAEFIDLVTVRRTHLGHRSGIACHDDLVGRNRLNLSRDQYAEHTVAHHVNGKFPAIRPQGIGKRICILRPIYRAEHQLGRTIQQADTIVLDHLAVPGALQIQPFIGKERRSGDRQTQRMV